MLRFHRPRTTDMSPERDRRSMEQEHHPRPPILNPSSGTSTSPLNNYVFPRQELATTVQSAPTYKLNFPSPTSSRAVPPDRFHSTHRAEWIGSPKAELVDAGECERGGVEGLSLDEPELERPGGVHGSRSQATSGTVGGAMSGCCRIPMTDSRTTAANLRHSFSGQFVPLSTHEKATPFASNFPLIVQVAALNQAFSHEMHQGRFH